MIKSSKLNKLVSVSMVFCVLFLAGCGKDEEENTTKKYITEENYTAEKGFANAAVTEDKLNAFYNMVEDAVANYGSANYGETKIEYPKGSPNDTGNPTDIEYTKKFFDFSKNGKLFLGGEIHCESITDRKSPTILITERKVNGKLEFRGDFKGSIEYKNAYVKTTYTDILNDKGQSDMTIEEQPSGEIVMNSNAGEPITLHEYHELFSKFINVI